MQMPDLDSAKATYRMGKEFYDKKQFARAYEAFNEAAASDYPAALRKLGLMYRYGLMVQRDVSRAREFWERAVAQGDGYATGLLGQLLLHGTSSLFGGLSHPRQALRGAQLIFSAIIDTIFLKKLTWED
jgi:TPR repeat protein